MNFTTHTDMLSVIGLSVAIIDVEALLLSRHHWLSVGLFCSENALPTAPVKSKCERVSTTSKQWDSALCRLPMEQCASINLNNCWNTNISF